MWCAAGFKLPNTDWMGGIQWLPTVADTTSNTGTTTLKLWVSFRVLFIYLVKQKLTELHLPFTITGKKCQLSLFKSLANESI